MMKSKLARLIGWGMVLVAGAAVAAPPVRVGAPAPAPTLLICRLVGGKVS